MLLQPAYAEPGDSCFEQYDGDLCGFLDAPLEAILEPFDYIFGDWFLVIVWGIFIGILWLRTQNTQLVGIIGLVVSGMITTFYEPARGIGLLLFLVSLGISLYQLFYHRIKYPTNA